MTDSQKDLRCKAIQTKLENIGDDCHIANDAGVDNNDDCKDKYALESELQALDYELMESGYYNK